MTTPSRPVTLVSRPAKMGLTYEEILKVWREADQVSVFEHAWLWDHLVPLRATSKVRPRGLDAPRRLAAQTATTSRCHRDSIAFVRRPCWRRWRATVDTIAGGRLDFGIGAGAAGLEPKTLQCESSRPTACLWFRPALPSGTSQSPSRSFDECGRGRAVRLRRAVHPAQGCRLRAQAQT